jgi:hypothetical protein
MSWKTSGARPVELFRLRITPSPEESGDQPLSAKGLFRVRSAPPPLPSRSPLEHAFGELDEECGRAGRVAPPRDELRQARAR